jgi:hypothetical protein
MFKDVGQAGTDVGICKMLMVISSSPFFAKPNVGGSFTLPTKHNCLKFVGRLSEAIYTFHF